MAQKTNKQRELIKNQCYEVLESFENQELTSSQVYDLIGDPTLDKRIVAAVLFQVSNRVTGKFQHVHNTRKGVYTYTKQPIKGRRTPSNAPKKRPAKHSVDITQNEETITITARTANNTFSATTNPVFDSAKGQMVETSEQLILHREDGTVWHARRVS